MVGRVQCAAVKSLDCVASWYVHDSSGQSPSPLSPGILVTDKKLFNDRAKVREQNEGALKSLSSVSQNGPAQTEEKNTLS